MQGIAFLLFFVIWFIAPLLWLHHNWKKETLVGLIFTIIGVLGLEFLLFMVLAIMNAMTYNGIWNWKFWFS